MAERVKAGVSYIAVGAICAVIGAGLGLRIYAGMPERVDDMIQRMDRLEARVLVNEDRMQSDMRTIHMQLTEIKTLIRNIE